MTDDELRSRLLALGYDVPLIVIRTWPIKTRGEAISRQKVIGWLEKRNDPHRTSNVAFPQMLARFDMQIFRRLEYARGKSQERSGTDRQSL